MTNKWGKILCYCTIYAAYANKYIHGCKLNFGSKDYLIRHFWVFE